jgi:hypothetical protein
MLTISNHQYRTQATGNRLLLQCPHFVHVIGDILQNQGYEMLLEGTSVRRDLVMHMSGNSENQLVGNTWLNSFLFTTRSTVCMTCSILLSTMEGDIPWTHQIRAFSIPFL